MEEKENGCDDCATGCCTSFGECICGNGINKRPAVPFDHFLIEKLTEENYEKLISKEEMEKSVETNTKIWEGIPVPEPERVNFQDRMEERDETLKRQQAAASRTSNSKTTGVVDDEENEIDIDII